MRTADTPPPGTTVPTKNGFAIYADRMRDRQAELDRHRTSAEQGLAKIQRQLHSEGDEEKRLRLWEKIRVFQAEFGNIAEEQAALDREKEATAREEERVRVEATANARKQLHQDGRETAAKVCEGLLVVEGLFAQLLELEQRARITKDTLRSAVPERMSELPDFWYDVGLDTTFVVSLTNLLRDGARLQTEHRSRGTPLPADMQQRIEREQAAMRKAT